MINKDNEAQIKSLQHRRLFTIYIAVRIASSGIQEFPNFLNYRHRKRDLYTPTVS